MRRSCFLGVLLASVLFLACATRSEANLVAYYPMDDPGDPSGVLDVVGGNHGVVEGTAPYTADAGGHTGQPGDYAIDFTSGNVLVAGGGFAGNAVANNSITFSFWEKAGYAPNHPPASSSFWAESPSAGGGQRGAQAHVPWSNRIIYWDTAGCCGANTRLTTSGASIADDNDWHHIAFVKEGNHKEIWVDGEWRASSDLSTAALRPFSNLFIGCSRSHTLRYHGLIDDFAVWDHALNHDEISQLAAGTAVPTDFPTPSVPPPPVYTGWVGRDINSPGSFQYDSGTGTVTVTGDGGDIWGSNDGFYFALPEDPANPGQPLKMSGDFIARARVVDMKEGVNAWQKSGIMARADLDPNSIHTMTAATQSNGIVQQWRDSKGAGSGWPGTRLPGSPNNVDGVANWLLMTRSGDTFTSTWAPDAGGAPGAWGTPQTHTSPNMPDDVYLGLSVTSHTTGNLATTVFDNVEFVPAMTLTVMGRSSGGSTWHFTSDPNFVDDPSGMAIPVRLGAGTNSVAAAVPASLVSSLFYVVVEATDSSASFAGALVCPPYYAFDTNGNGVWDTGEDQFFTTQGFPFGPGDPQWAGSASLVPAAFFPGPANEVGPAGNPFPGGTEAIWYGPIGGTVYFAARVPAMVYVPEPTTSLVLATGLLLVARRRRRRK